MVKQVKDMYGKTYDIPVYYTRCAITRTYMLYDHIYIYLCLSVHVYFQLNDTLILL